MDLITPSPLRSAGGGRRRPLLVKLRVSIVAPMSVEISNVATQIAKKPHGIRHLALRVPTLFIRLTVAIRPSIFALIGPSIY